MTDPEQDEVFEAYLKRRSVLPALDEGPEPTVALDQKVLAQAREAIGPRSAGVAGGGGAAVVGRRTVAVAGGDREGVTGGGTAAGGEAAARGGAADAFGGGAAREPTGVPRAPRWAVPIALAATVLLCLSVVINISLNTNRPSPNLERMTAARADLKASAKANAIAESSAAADARAPADAAVPAAAADHANTRSAAAGSASASSRDELAGVQGGVSNGEVILPGAKVAGVAPRRPPVEVESVEMEPAAPEALAQAPTVKEKLAGGESAASGFAGAGKAVPMSPATAGSPTAARPPAAAGPRAADGPPVVAGLPADGTHVAARAARSTSAVDKAELFAKQAGVATRTQGSPSAPASAPASASAPADSSLVAPMPADPAASGQPGGQRASATDQARTARRAAPGQSPVAASAPPAASTPAEGSAPAAASNAVASHPTDPKVWLRQINALRAAGKAAEADAEMRRFAAAFPAYVPKPAAPAPPGPSK
jgi:hypothetical protein